MGYQCSPSLNFLLLLALARSFDLGLRLALRYLHAYSTRIWNMDTYAQRARCFHQLVPFRNLPGQTNQEEQETERPFEAN